MTDEKAPAEEEKQGSPWLMILAVAVMGVFAFVALRMIPGAIEPRERGAVIEAPVETVIERPEPAPGTTTAGGGLTLAPIRGGGDGADGATATETDTGAADADIGDTAAVEGTDTSSADDAGDEAAADPDQNTSTDEPATENSTEASGDTGTDADAPAPDSETAGTEPSEDGAAPDPDTDAQDTPDEGADGAASEEQSDAAVGDEGPTFDLVRIDEDGAGIVAGRAEPGAQVQVMSNGQEIGTAQASETGEFVAFVEAPASDEGQTLTLVALGEAAERLRSTEEVFILPVPTKEEQQSAPPAIIKASDTEVQVIQPGGVAKVDQVTLDAISYDAAGAVKLTGRGVPGRVLRVYVNTSNVATAKVSDGGTWNSTLSDVEEGRYTLRVDELNDAGTVTSRVESPFQRVFPTDTQKPSAITVQPGNSLWVIASERYGDGLAYTQIYAANSQLIRDPDLIYPGQVLDLPDTDSGN